MAEAPTEPELIARIEDDAASEAELEAYFTFEENRLPVGTEPQVAASPDIVNLSTADSGIIGAFNKRWRRRRERRFESRQVGFGGVTIVAQGDSWFQYPLKIRIADVIDHLSEEPDINVFSLCRGGDWLANIVERKLYLHAIERCRPSVFLISGGGNDLVGKERLMWILRKYRPGEEARWYTEGATRQLIEHLRELYLEVFGELTQRYPDMRIICHGYDYAIPDHGEWLGRPMEQIGIEDLNLQRNIVKVLIDRFNEMLIDLAKQFPQVEHIDCRETVQDWHDELHPTKSSYGRVAEKFKARILR